MGTKQRMQGFTYSPKPQGIAIRLSINTLEPVYVQLYVLRRNKLVREESMSTSIRSTPLAPFGGLCGRWDLIPSGYIPYTSGSNLSHWWEQKLLVLVCKMFPLSRPGAACLVVR